jgi:hypothetical protein
MIYDEDLGVMITEDELKRKYDKEKENAPMWIAIAFIVGLILGMLLMKGSINEEALYSYGILP